MTSTFTLLAMASSVIPTRVLPTEEARDLLALVREIADEQLLPRVDEAEAEHRFPREVFTMLGQTGLLSLAYPEEFGGAGQPYEVYLQVVEEIARAWMSVAVGVSVHSLTAFPMANFGTPEQQERIFESMWFCAARSADLALPGKFKKVQVGRESILVVRGRDGDMIPLSNIVTIEEAVAPRELNHFNKLRSAEISASLAPGGGVT